jgi:serine/threonine protein kinase
MYHAGLEGEFNIMVLELVGKTLDELLSQHKQFSLGTSLLLTHQLLRRVEYIHDRGIVHQDLKPENFAMGLGKKERTVFIFDFGLAKRYKNGSKHIPYSEGHSLCGTARYASVNNHLGIEQTRRDDLESLLYVCVHFLKGKLPWQGLKADSAEKKYALIKDSKAALSPDELCRGLPRLYPEWLKKARLMRFDEAPSYPAMRADLD